MTATSILEREIAPNQLDELEALRDSVSRGVEYGIRTMDERFGPNQPIEQRLPFHNGRHGEDVVRRAQLIGTAIQDASSGELMNDRDMELVSLIAANHDTVQDYVLVPDEHEGHPIVKRKRNSGQNESVTANELIDFMRQENTYSSTGDIYTDEDMSVAEEGIMSTVPGWDQEIGTVVQPNKVRNQNVVSDIIALADLGSAGIDGAKSAVKDCDLNFLEENADVPALLASVETINDDTKQWLKDRILAYTELQIPFINGRKQLIDKDLGHFPPKVATALKARVFTKFDESIATIETAMKRRQAASADEVIAEISQTLDAIAA